MKCNDFRQMPKKTKGPGKADFVKNLGKQKKLLPERHTFCGMFLFLIIVITRMFSTAWTNSVTLKSS